MRYMLLVYTDEAQMESASEEMLRLVAEGHRAVQEEARRAGALVAADPLAVTGSATTVRVRDGKRMVVDGPFAETKEQLAGFYILDCRDLDEAIDWAEKIPTVAMSRGLDEGLRLLETLASGGELSGYRAFYTTRAELLRRLGRDAEALPNYERALGMTSNEVERSLLKRRIASLRIQTQSN